MTTESYARWTNSDAADMSSTSLEHRKDFGLEMISTGGTGSSEHDRNSLGEIKPGMNFVQVLKSLMAVHMRQEGKLATPL